MQNSSSITMKALSVSERPYELLEQNGAQSLTDAQLLAILLQHGTNGENALTLATRMLSLCSGESKKPLDELFSMPLFRLEEFKGIGRVKALQLTAVKELSNRLSASSPLETVQVGNPSEIADLYMEELRNLKQEVVKVVYLNCKNKILFSRVVSRGSVNRSVVSVREIFIPALEQGSTKIILLHNHPSGDPGPSEADIHLTNHIASAGELLEIHLLDHIIIGNHRYYSMKEAGVLT